MLCSNCSEKIKPIVAVDVDGTMGDYHGHFLRFASEYLDAGLGPILAGSSNMYGGQIDFSQYCMSLFKIDLATYRQVKLAYRQGGMKRTMPIFAGASQLCWGAVQAGAELWITTTRPYLSLDNIVPDTVEWLERNQLPFDGILFDEDKYEVLANRVDSERVVAVLDDLPEMYDAASAAINSDVPILVMGKFNRQVRRPIMVSLWDCAYIVNSRIEGWYGSHA